MAQDPAGALFCDNIGSSSDNLRCCYPNDQDSPACRDNFGPHAPTFTQGCNATGNCLADCANVTIIYRSLLQNKAYDGDNRGPRQRFKTCANVPALAGYLKQGVLNERINSTIGDYLPDEASGDGLKDVTSAVTECLTSTCRFARYKANCAEPCKAVNMLINSTTPNVEGINTCLHSLCNGSYDSLPYADADIVGIGVFASYIMQCALVILLFFGLTGFEIHSHRRRMHPKPGQSAERPDAESTNESNPKSQANTEEKVTHRSIFENVLVQYHQAQCYFSATLQIASLSYGIFETDMLITFMLTPLATNGVLPVIFAYILLIRCGKATPDVTLLTLLCWTLATIVYWVLYSSIIPINSDIKTEAKRYRAYQQFMYKLSAIDACGGYSALAVCPQNNELTQLARTDISRASHKLRVLTPIIWAFATFCLFGALVIKLRHRLHHRERKQKDKAQRGEYTDAEQKRLNKTQPDAESTPLTGLRMNIVYYVVVLCFLAGMGMQLSLLSIGTSLKMTNKDNWGFGQIVAVTIWAPAVLGYIYGELKKKFGRDKDGGVNTQA